MVKPEYITLEVTQKDEQRQFWRNGDDFILGHVDRLELLDMTLKSKSADHAFDLQPHMSAGHISLHVFFTSSQSCQN